MRDWDIVSGIGITALFVASARAIESSRAEPLIVDPYAATFVEAANAPTRLPTRVGELSSPDALLEQMSHFMALRSRFFDEYLAEATTAGARQVVILAAGLDSRAYRLDWPSETTVYEVDQPGVLEFKEQVLADASARPQCERRTVAADLRDDWPKSLQVNGFDPALPTAWLVEGLLLYLPAEATAALLDTIHSLSAPGSTIAIEHVEGMKDALEDPRAQKLLKEVPYDYTRLLPEGPAGDPVGQLSQLGWAVGEVSVADLAERYGRSDDGVVMAVYAVCARCVTGRLG